MSAVRWQVYLLRCADGSLYTGVSSDVQRRLSQHNGERAGGPKYTRGRRPVKLLWSEAAASRAQAQQREAQIKKLPRQAKLALLCPVPGCVPGRPGGPADQ